MHLDARTDIVYTNIASIFLVYLLCSNTEIFSGTARTFTPVPFDFEFTESSPALKLTCELEEWFDDA